MRSKWMLPIVAAGLAGCGAARIEPATVPEADVVTADPPGRASTPVHRPVLSTEMLPPMVATATLKAETPLFQRPKTGSVVMKTLPAGETVQLLGALDNADGQWRSVASGDLQGWIRAAQVSMP